jgi:hypothetical protein
MQVDAMAPNSLLESVKSISAKLGAVLWQVSRSKEAISSRNQKLPIQTFYCKRRRLARAY